MKKQEGVTLQPDEEKMLGDYDRRSSSIAAGKKKLEEVKRERKKNGRFLLTCLYSGETTSGASCGNEGALVCDGFGSVFQEFENADQHQSWAFGTRNRW
jgi:hypothetical protein